MIFNKDRKLAFVLPYKTGTNTIIKFLTPMGWKTLGDQHAFTTQCLKSFPNLNNYTIYGFLRNPLMRFESSALNLKRLERTSFLKQKIEEMGKTAETASYEDIIDLFKTYENARAGLLSRLQSEWLNHPKVTVLDFDNFESELRRVTGYTTQPITRENVSADFGKSVITDKVRAFVREYYAADYALAKDRLGKEYNP
jgi:hypothetical protein